MDSDFKHVILRGRSKEPCKYSGEISTYEFYQSPKILGATIHWDSDDKGAMHGSDYKNLSSARQAFRRLNPVRGGYEIKWEKINEPLTKYEIMRLKEKNR